MPVIGRDTPREAPQVGEGTAAGVTNDDKHCWVQAEAVVGFLNAWQLSGERPFLDAALRTWSYIEARVVDKNHGEWFAVLTRDGTPRPDYPEFADSCKNRSVEMPLPHRPRRDRA